MNKKIKYLLECINRTGKFLAYRKEMIWNDFYESLQTKYLIYNAANVTVNKGEEDEYEVLKITYLLRLTNDELKGHTTLKSNYASFTREIDLLLFLKEYCDNNNISY